MLEPPPGLASPTIDIRPGIGGILKHAAHPGAVCLAPDDVLGRRSEKRPHRQEQAVAAQIAHHRPGTSQLTEFGEDQHHPGLHLLVGIEGDRAGAVLGQSGGNGKTQISSCRLLALALMQAQLDLMQFGLAHDARQAEKQTVVIGARIVEPFAVGDQNPEQRAQVEELVPVPIVARQPRRVETDHQAGVAEADLGDQPAEALALDAARTGLAEIVVDDMHALGRPAERDGAIDEAILQLGALLVMPHLVHGRLADVDVGQPAAMLRRDLLVRAIRPAQHGGSSVLAPGRAAGEEAAPPGIGRSASASAPAGRATGAAMSFWREAWGLSGTQRGTDSTECSSRITSSERKAKVRFKWRINVSRIRTSTRACESAAPGSVVDPAARSVTERRMDRRRPSGRRTTT